MTPTHPLHQAAAAAPTGHVPMADPDAYALAAADRWQTVGWRCTCGATPDPSDAAWRWNGSGWEHNHGGQAGHFRAEYTPPPGTLTEAQIRKVYEKVAASARTLESGFDDPAHAHLDLKPGTLLTSPASECCVPSLTITRIYEVIDQTDDESYYTCGVFLTLAEAKAAIAIDDPRDLPTLGDLEDTAEFHIIEHKIGMTGYGTRVYRRRWENVYDEAKDEYVWRVKEEEAA